jgi:hypothetical protein
MGKDNFIKITSTPYFNFWGLINRRIFGVVGKNKWERF